MHAIRADCLLMKQLGCMHSRWFYICKCSPSYPYCIFKSGTYVDIDVPIVGLQHIPYCLPSPPFVLLHCWMMNSIAQCIQVYDPVGAFTHQLPMHCFLREPLLMVILTLSPSTAKGGLPGLAHSRNNQQPESLIENLSAACLITAYSCALHNYTTHGNTSCTHFEFNYYEYNLALYRDAMPLRVYIHPHFPWNQAYS